MIWILNYFYAFAIRHSAKWHTCSSHVFPCRLPIPRFSRWSSIRRPSRHSLTHHVGVLVGEFTFFFSFLFEANVLVCHFSSCTVLFDAVRVTTNCIDIRCAVWERFPRWAMKCMRERGRESKRKSSTRIVGMIWVIGISCWKLSGFCVSVWMLCRHGPKAKCAFFW